MLKSQNFQMTGKIIPKEEKINTTSLPSTTDDVAQSKAE